VVCWFFSYNHIDKHSRDRTMQQIISSEFKCGCLLHFEEAFDEEKATYDKIKVCELRISDLLSYVFAFMFLVCFFHSCSIFVCSRFVLILLEKTIWILELVCLMVQHEQLLLPWFMLVSLLVFL
jgi:hypothetical protein